MEVAHSSSTGGLVFFVLLFFRQYHPSKSFSLHVEPSQQLDSPPPRLVHGCFSLTQYTFGPPLRLERGPGLRSPVSLSTALSRTFGGWEVRSSASTTCCRAPMEDNDSSNKTRLNSRFILHGVKRWQIAEQVALRCPLSLSWVDCPAYSPAYGRRRRSYSAFSTGSSRQFFRCRDLPHRRT